MQWRTLLLLPLATALLWIGDSQAETIRVGATAGPHAEILEAVVPVAKRNGLDIKVVEFSDGARINPALDDGELEANAFQHKPYLDKQVRDLGLKLEPVGPTVLYPMAAYSKRYKSLDALPEKAVIAIPNDPTNAGRALKLLEAGGLIRLKPVASVEAAVYDITDNPKKLRIRELEAAQIPRSLDDVDFAVINTNYALRAGLNPVKDSLLRESVQSDYVSLIAVRSADRDKPWVRMLLESYHSPEVRKFVDEKYEGSLVPGW